ncbi:CRISPR-associated endonuclease Cas2 [Brevibacillus thermoruber]|jgi:CRISPR-associated protein Cas2|uniref:CRISPR-associated endoribonuclease Cas2 n=1 Tax=Brevibacillus thermoruber TaxID=33942 RepID=A0A9X3TV19_9BACL|nr:CRISPR-associated endonuclease Cas2 [Brevibacillus thermoruber]MDA5111054.1 CRISPR-associated endonuclease Cas2 [Brevibacillus thermoruber]
MNFLLIYDITEDKIRNKVAEVCKDYGMQRVQYSAFFGTMGRNYIEELEMKMKRLLKQANGSVIIFPLSKESIEGVRKIESYESLPESEAL